KSLVFCKTKQTEITDDNVQNVVFILSLMGGTINAVYNALKQVYAPLISQNSSELSDQIQLLLADIQSLSEDANGAGDFANDGSKNKKGGNYIVFFCSDDHLYSAIKLTIQVFRDLFTQVSDAYENLESGVDLDEVLEVEEVVRDVLDDAWRVVDGDMYTEERMRNMLQGVGQDMQVCIQKSLSKQDMWLGDVSLVTDSLSKAIEVCRNWIKTCELLTKQYWKNYSTHPWKGTVEVPNTLTLYEEQLKEVLKLRKTVEEASMLLTKSEIKDLKLNNLFANFKTVNATKPASMASSTWKRAVDQFNEDFQVVEKFVSQKLKEKMNGLESNHQQLVREMDKYIDLLSRPNVSVNMQFEKEKMISQLLLYVEQQRNNMEMARRDKVVHSTMDYSVTVNKLLEYQLVEKNIESVMTLSEMLMKDMTGYNKLSKQATSCLEDVVVLKQDLFQEWSRDSQQFFDGKFLKMKGQLLQLNSKNGKLEVMFGDRLIMLLRDATVMSSLGYIMPKNIQNHLKEGEEFRKYGIKLKQIAHFYNTVDQQIIPCQQPMMLESAVAFENLVTKFKDGSDGISWNNPKELEEYVSKLEKASDTFMGNIRRLRKCHEVIHNKVVLNLMDTDMLKKLSTWKSELVEIRRVMNELINQGFKAENMKLWKHHWNVQLYKALEHQYYKGLIAFNDNMPEMKVELVFSGQQIAYRPSYEEIQAKYFREIRKFCSIPTLFKGVGDGTVETIFVALTDKNPQVMFRCFHQANRLFKQLLDIKEQYNPWVVLGTMNLEELITSTLHDVDEWEFNFKMIKTKSKEVDQIPNEIKVSSITISLIPLKINIEDQLQHLFEALLVTLKKSLLVDINKIDNFIVESTATFNLVPRSLDDINNINAKHLAIINDTHKTQETFELISQKNRLLMSLVGSGHEGLDDIRQKWNKFELMLKSHREKLKDEMEVMRSNSSFRCKEFEEEVNKYVKKWAHMNLGDGKKGGDKYTGSLENINILKEMSMEFEELKSKKTTLINESKLFDIEPPNLKNYQLIEKDMDDMVKVIDILMQFQTECSKYQEEIWIAYRTKYFSFDAFLDQWVGKLAEGSRSSFVQDVLKEIHFNKELMPILKWVRGDAFSQENWTELYALMGMPNYEKLNVNDVTFGDVLKHGHEIMARVDEIKELNGKAQSEVVIRDALRELEGWGSGATLTLTQDNAKLSLVKDWKDLFNKIGEHQSLVQSLKNSSHFKYFQDKVTLWETRLSDLDSILHNLNQIQRKWIYLEPVFVQGALKKEEGRFKKVDDEFKKYMMDIKRDPKVMSLLFKIGLKTSLVNLLDQLQRCQKTLNDYLESKRLSFPRFYFIGDDDLLEILGQSVNPSVIQNHLKKLFSGINSVELDGDDENKQGNKRIRSMISQHEEVVRLSREVQVESDVEVWLNSLTKEMKNTLKELISSCLSSSSKGLDSNKFPAQVLCVTGCIVFTQKCENAISKQDLHGLHDELKQQLNYYTSVNADLKNDKSGNSNFSVGLKLKDLIFDTIHHIEVVDMLESRGVKYVQDWFWQKQLRFYNTNEQTCKIKMGDPEMRHTFDYTYEYQGNAPKLVHTPLTDKCYLTLTQALSYGLGGNPYGPAGTGKTESVKALGGLFGRQVLVFNCDEGIDVKSMGRIFIGLVQCGAWGCFDEFNRLDEAVLSAVSMQIQVIQNAIKNQASTLQLLDKTVKVNLNSGIFITMNPAGKGYGGRQKLPDNLKQLFRPVSMSQPDNELIAEVILYSEGFKNGKAIGKKLVAVFDLSRKLLTQQQHYDWGLRSIKSVLKSSGSLLRQSQIKSNEEKGLESQLVIQALQMNTLSKLTSSDRLQFQLLIKDVFLNVDFKDVQNEELEKMLKEVYEENQYDVIKSQIVKSIELYEQLKQRMGILIVGPSRSGKSTLWRNLRGALMKMGLQIKLHVLNPKAMPKSQLLGQIDSDTREWVDGVLTNFSRQVIKESKNTSSWIVCDGDIDPEWIESLNSVLDDNHLLTLPSGERIQFGNDVNFVFETHDLRFASPATVSRMGMIFLSEGDIGMEAVASKWLRNRPDGDAVKEWVQTYYLKCLNWIKREGDFYLNQSLISTACNGLKMLDGDVESVQHMIAKLFTGLSGNLTDECKKKFASEIFSITGEYPPDTNDILNFKYDAKSGSLLSLNLKCVFICGLEESGNQLSGQIVMNPETERSINAFRSYLLSDRHEPFILLGPEGSGKRTLLEHCLVTECQTSSTELAVINCTSHTLPEHIIHKLNQLCSIVNTSSGRKYKPKTCEKLVLLLKDVDYPHVDKWGTSSFLAFLQQILTYGGFYDSTMEMISFDGLQIIASMTIGASDLSNISSRFTSLLPVCSISCPNTNELEYIYTNRLLSVLHPSLSKHQFWGKISNVDMLSRSMIALYDELKRNFNANDHSHYVFTLKHLTDWTESFSRYDLNELSTHNSSNHLIQIWSYEAHCLFREKLVGSKSRRLFDEMLKTIIHNTWSGRIEAGNFDEDVYVLYVSDSSVIKKTKHLHKMSLIDYKLLLEKVLAKYEKEYGEETIVFFPDFLKVISKVDRVLSSAGESMVMCGQSGVGRKTCIKLMAYMHQLDLFSPKITRSYGMKQFKSDLKNIVQTAVIENREVIFLLEDYQMTEAQFYQLINGMISEGEVSNLYSPEELETVVANVRDQCSSEGFQGNPLQYLFAKLKQNLHICLLMDWSDESFVTTCKNNPSIMKLSNFIWMDMWNEECAKEVSCIYSLDKKVKGRKEADTESGVEEMSKEHKLSRKFFKHFYEIHRSVLDASSSSSSSSSVILDHCPRKFVTLLKTFSNLYQSKKKTIIERLQRLQKGLSKLQEAKNHVDSLKREADEQHKVLAEKQKEADNSMSEITSTLSNAGNRKIEMEDLQKEAVKEGEKLEKRKKLIEAELSEIEPIVQEAKSAVGNIRTETLGEIRALRAPPDTIRDILEGVMIIMGNPDTSWLAMKSFLAKRGVKEEIQNFDARKITPETRKSIENLLKKNGNSFDIKNAKRASEAAAPLASWVTANTKYAAILEKIQPLEREQNELQKNMSSVGNKMKKLGDGLQRVDERVNELRQKFERITNENAQLKIKLDKSQEIISSAETLVTKLSEEFKRWTAQIKELETELNELNEKALYSSAFIIYLSSAPENVRLQMKQQWFKNLSLSNFDNIRFLSSENDQLLWKVEGLPSDGLSLENAVAIQNSTQTPMIIDPSFRSTNWIRNHYKNNNVEAINAQDSNLFNQVELAVKFGKTLIIMDVDVVEAALVPLLRRDIVHQGSRKIIQVGDKMIDYDDKFTLFLSTRNPSPPLPSHILSLLTIINFTITKSGLTSQLLATTLMNEKPELESRKTELLSNEENMKKQLTDLEDSLLQELGNAKGDILENKELLDSLNQTKQNSGIISQSLDESLQLQTSLDEERNSFLPLADAGSKMYFAIHDLHLINNMYQFSLESFVKLFNKLFKLEKTATSKDSSEYRIRLIKSLQYYVYTYYSRSLFKKDCLVFAMHLINNIQTDSISKEEWDAYIGLTSSGSLDSVQLKLPDWIDKDQTNAVLLLKETFPELYSSLNLTDTNIWSDWVLPKSTAKIPQKLSSKITPFQELLTVQAIKPESLLISMNSFACNYLGFKELSALNLNLRQLFEQDSHCREPILFIISQGADPSQELEDLAKKTVGLDKYNQVALGQGQTDTAIQLLKSCANKGEWLCLKNLHLSISWLSVLEKEFKSLEPHENFRLWLTSEAHQNFPAVFLKTCLKVTYEAPAGVKKNLLRTYDSWGTDTISKNRNVMRSQSLFTLAWFHAVVQERRSYIPQGWTKFYEFGQTDLQCAVQIIDKLFSKSDTSNISWGFVHGLFEEAVYGGKIDNNDDNQVLISYLNQFFNSNMNKSLGPLKAPQSYQFKDHIDVIESLPEFDKPSFSGLPENINLVTEKLVANEIINHLKQLKRSNLKNSKFDRELWCEEINPMINFWKKLNMDHSFLNAKHNPEKTTNNKSELDSLSYFVSLEVNTALNVVHYVDHTLNLLEKVLSGKQLLSAEVAHMASELINIQTPSCWLNKWEGPENPMNYMRTLIKKTSSIFKWKEKVEKGRLLDNTIDLSDLLRPESFINAHRQLSSRSVNSSIDNVCMECSWHQGNKSGNRTLKLKGLKLEGCNFDGNKLTEKRGHEPVYSEVPECHISWTIKKTANYDLDYHNRLYIPVYSDTTRNTLVTYLYVPINEDKSKWIQFRPAFFID
ncbi:hypothetical protein HELRODRAFT_66985, partial [Helobdella robusta]|uniref:Cytoplasmic dynein 2 heavy chain 1 n=1 Tax=Helobdella robusta TaxID=6412 RepID=T1FYU8_HELRO